MGAPAAVEPRMACPACGGQVHPIAGRCKHCKADLNRLRAGGTAPRAPQGARPALVALGGSNGHAAGNGASTQPAPAPVMSLSTLSPEASDATVAPRSSWSSRWPLVVAFVAVIAIIASVALLLFGSGHDNKKTDHGVRRHDGPAPELTPTDPLAPQVTPPAPPGSTMPSPSIPTPRPDPGDPGNGAQLPQVPSPSAPQPTSGPRTATDFFHAAVDVACRRMTTCSSDAQIAEYCTQARQMLPQMGSTMDQMCSDYDSTAAAQCLDAVSRFPCPSGAMDADAMGNALMGMTGCQKVCPSMFAGLGAATGGSLGMTQ